MPILAQRRRRRPLAEYAPEPDLAAALAGAAAVAEETSGKPTLHLAVLGHVDAGKSTLMGRLLADLGCAACTKCPKTNFHSMGDLLVERLSDKRDMLSQGLHLR